uniref:hypothetical protein n=1 Tax=Paenibacillus popilliae TaxID=78057 RepID=UPI001868BA55|nr:hypothetical protein [Paenibacillus popilliae]
MILMVTVVQPKRADAFLPALVIPVVGGMEVAASVFTGLATLGVGLWLMDGVGEIEQSQAEEIATHVTVHWDKVDYVSMRNRVYGDAMTWGSNTTTVTVEPEIIDAVNAVEYNRYAKHFWTYPIFIAGSLAIYSFDTDAPYGFLIDGGVYKYLYCSFNKSGQAVSLDISASSTISAQSKRHVFDVKDAEVVSSLLKISSAVDFFYAIQRYYPVVDAGTMTPVVPKLQDVFNPDMPRDIAIPTGMFRTYPKDVYGQPDAPELTYRPKTKDYISNDGLVYPAADVIVAVPIPRVNDKGDVGVATPAGDWVSVRPGNPVVPDVVNPDIPGVGAPAIPIPGVDNPVIPGVGSPVIPGVGTGSPAIPGVVSPAIPGVVNPAIPAVANPAIPAIPELTETSTNERINWEPLRLAGDALTRKFPFSVPWDVKRQLDVFDVVPQAPRFEVNEPLFNLSGHTIPLQMTIDLSHFDLVASITRWFLVIAFDIGVILSMRRFMPE